MEPIKGKPGISNSPTSHNLQQGSRFFFPLSKKDSPSNQSLSSPISELKVDQLVEYAIKKLKINSNLENRLPNPELFRQILARVIIELQLPLDDRGLQDFILKLLNQEQFPPLSFHNQTSLVPLLRFLGTIVALELEQLDQEDSFTHLLQFLSGYTDIKRDSDTDALLSLVQYKGRNQKLMFWWEWHFFELSDGYEGRLQFLFGPNKNLPYKIVLEFPNPSENTGQLTFGWIEPERQVMELYLTESFQELGSLSTLKKTLVKNLRKCNFFRIHESIQFPNLSAESNTKETDLGKGLDLFG